MLADTLSWLAEQLGFPELQEAADRSALQANAAARQALGEPLPATLREAAARLAGVPAAELEPLWSRLASDGRATEAVGERFRLALEQTDTEGTLRLTALPLALEHHRHAMATQMAAGVVHEVANALSAVIGWAELGRRDRARTDEALAAIEDSARAARSAARRLLQSVREHKDTPEPIDVAAVVTDVTRLLQPRAGEAGVRLEPDAPAPVWIAGRPDALITLVWNLAQNAIEALAAGGTVRVAASGERDRASLVVSDDGPGMDEPTRKRAFAPYFTTKSAGTGLGLWLVRQAAETLGASIELDSEPGNGTRFEVTLPRMEQHGPSGPVRRNSGVRARGVDVSVLVVEDDDALRELVATTLDIRGARVHAVRTAAEARATRESFDVALVDMCLPDGAGDQLLSELQDRGAVQVGALVSGVTEPPRGASEWRERLWLRKPFEPIDLVETVRELVRRLEDPAPRESGTEG
ncbi:MAG: ATP-binding protein [Polyangiales bacterium]